MKTPHKHADTIHAWADGAEIECRLDEYDKWDSVKSPQWTHNFEYRIKPEPKHNLVLYACTWFDVGHGTHYLSSKLTKLSTSEDTLKLTFDGETNKLIKAEVI